MLNSKIMRIIFMGSAEFAGPALAALIKAGRDQIVAVVCPPARPSGRHQQIKQCPLDEYAISQALPVITPENINTAESVAVLRALKPDLVVVAAYGQILKPAILTLPEKGCLNLHASLLPGYRGAAPIQWAIARGENKTGVTAMLMNEKMDAGDIIAQAAEEILADDTAVSLGKRLGASGADLLLKTIEMIRAGEPPRIKQNEALATYAPGLKKSDGLLDWKKTARELENRVRAFQPWPTCFFILNGVMIRVLRAGVEDDSPAQPGTVIEARGAGPRIQTGRGSLRLLELQPAGKNAMSGRAFLCGKRISAGENLI